MPLRGQTYTEFKCLEEGCGCRVRLPRPKGRMREVGHIKTMWCYKCKKETDHKEHHEQEDFNPFQPKAGDDSCIKAV